LSAVVRRSGFRRPVEARFCRFSAGLLLVFAVVLILSACPGFALPLWWAKPERIASGVSTQPHPAVARIVALEGNVCSFGTGTLIASHEQYALLITNWHVIRDAKGQIEARFPNGQQVPAVLVAADPVWDLALLVTPPVAVAPVSLAPRVAMPGERLIIAGYGRGSYRAAAGPCVQFVAPGIGYPAEMLEVAVAARQGDSGGPIFNQQGQLAGVLFGTTGSRTIGSHSLRVQQFLNASQPRLPAALTQLAALTRSRQLNSEYLVSTPTSPGRFPVAAEVVAPAAFQQAVVANSSDGRAPSNSPAGSGISSTALPPKPFDPTAALQGATTATVPQSTPPNPLWANPSLTADSAWHRSLAEDPPAAHVAANPLGSHGHEATGTGSTSRSSIQAKGSPAIGVSSPSYSGSFPASLGGQQDVTAARSPDPYGTYSSAAYGPTEPQSYYRPADQAEPGGSAGRNIGRSNSQSRANASNYSRDVARSGNSDLGSLPRETYPYDPEGFSGQESYADNSFGSPYTSESPTTRAGGDGRNFSMSYRYEDPYRAESPGWSSEQINSASSFDSEEAVLPSSQGTSAGLTQSMGTTPKEGHLPGSSAGGNSPTGSGSYERQNGQLGREREFGTRDSSSYSRSVPSRQPEESWALNSSSTGFSQGKTETGRFPQRETTSQANSEGAIASFGYERQSEATGWNTSELAGDSASPGADSSARENPGTPSDQSPPQKANARKPPAAQSSPGEIPGLLPAEPPPDPFTFLSDLCYELFAILSVSGVALILLKLLAPKRRRYYYYRRRRYAPIYGPFYER
jgi:hypothetical protein